MDTDHSSRLALYSVAWLRSASWALSVTFCPIIDIIPCIRYPYHRHSPYTALTLTIQGAENLLNNKFLNMLTMKSLFPLATYPLKTISSTIYSRERGTWLPWTVLGIFESKLVQWRRLVAELFVNQCEFLRLPGLRKQLLYASILTYFPNSRELHWFSFLKFQGRRDHSFRWCFVQTLSWSMYTTLTRSFSDIFTNR